MLRASLQCDPDMEAPAVLRASRQRDPDVEGANQIRPSLLMLMQA